MAREGFEETRPRTGRATEDQRHARRATPEPAGSGSHRWPSGGPPGPPHGRPREPLPTRVEGLPDLPDAYEQAVARGLGRLALALDEDQRRAIDDHVRLLLAWNRAINLTSIDDPAGVAIRHVLDSLTAVALLRDRGIGRLIDLGSGGGFPGLPLAVTVPLQHTLLVESVGKKARFLAAVVRATGLAARVEVAAERVEAVTARPEHRGAWPAVTARAVAPLSELIELAFPLLTIEGCLVAWKRADPVEAPPGASAGAPAGAAPSGLAAELKAATRALAALGGGRLEVHPVALPELAGHRLVVATRTGAVPALFPRDPRWRKREPW